MAADHAKVNMEHIESMQGNEGAKTAGIPLEDLKEDSNIYNARAGNAREHSMTVRQALHAYP